MIVNKYGRCSALIALVSILAGCGGGKEEKKVAVPSTSKNNVLVVNVLSKSLYDDAHIPGSISVPLMDLQKEAQKWDKETPVVVYCSNYTCTASAGGVRILNKLGFKDVSAYEGGMAEWYQLSRENSAYVVEGPAKENYLSVKVSQSSEATHDVKVISAQELHKKLLE